MHAMIKKTLYLSYNIIIIESLLSYKDILIHTYHCYISWRVCTASYI